MIRNRWDHNIRNVLLMAKISIYAKKMTAPSPTTNSASTLHPACHIEARHYLATKAIYFQSSVSGIRSLSPFATK